MPSANIQTLYGIEWKMSQVWKRKRNWVSLEVEVQEYHEEICSSIIGSVKNKQYWKAHERVCVYVIPVWFLQEKRGQKFIQSLTSIWTFQSWAELNLLPKSLLQMWCCLDPLFQLTHFMLGY